MAITDPRELSRISREIRETLEARARARSTIEHGTATASRADISEQERHAVSSHAVGVEPVQRIGNVCALWLNLAVLGGLVLPWGALMLGGGAWMLLWPLWFIVGDSSDGFLLFGLGAYVLLVVKGEAPLTARLGAVHTSGCMLLALAKTLNLSTAPAFPDLQWSGIVGTWLGGLGLLFGLFLVSGAGWGERPRP